MLYDIKRNQDILVIPRLFKSVNLSILKGVTSVYICAETEEYKYLFDVLQDALSAVWSGRKEKNRLRCNSPTKIEFNSPHARTSILL